MSEAEGSELGSSLDDGAMLRGPPGPGAGLGIGLGESPGLGTDLGIELGESSGFGTGFGTELGEPTLYGDRDRGKRYRRLYLRCLITGFDGRSRN